MSLDYDDILREIVKGGSISLTPPRSEKLVKLSTDLGGAFVWGATTEGHSFWAYVSKRLAQLAAGYGWNEKGDDRDDDDWREESS